MERNQHVVVARPQVIEEEGHHVAGDGLKGGVHVGGVEGAGGEADSDTGNVDTGL